MTTTEFLAAVAQYAEDVGADHVAQCTARVRQVEAGVVTGAWISEAPAVRIHRTTYLPYIARTRIAADLGLVVIPDGMTDHVTAGAWEMG